MSEKEISFFSFEQKKFNNKFNNKKSLKFVDKNQTNVRKKKQIKNLYHQSPAGVILILK